MKIVTIGASPYLLTSLGQLHADIIKHLYISDIPIASFVWGHDVTYYVPHIDNDGKHHYYFEFPCLNQTHKTPLVPLQLKDLGHTTTVVYEMLKLFAPDIVITIGNYNDFLYMQAIKELYPEKIKWLAVLANSSHPINEQNQTLSHSMDGVLCTNFQTYEMIKQISPLDNIKMCYVGADSKQFFSKKDKDDYCYRIMTCGKNSQSDNLPVLMQAMTDLQQKGFNYFQLYVHSNVLDDGDFDMSLLQNRFDPKQDFIKYPDNSVSLSDGYSRDDYIKELSKSNIFVSTSMSSATCISIFEAIACGCMPLMTSNPCSKEIAAELNQYLPGFFEDDLLIQSVQVMTIGEMYLYVCDQKDLEQKLKNLRLKLSENKGYERGLSQFIETKQRRYFLKELSSVLNKVHEDCLETIHVE